LTAMPKCQQTNANLSSTGPTLNLNSEQQDLIARVAHKNIISHDKLGNDQGPCEGEAPVALLYTQVKTLNDLLLSIRNNMHSPSVLSNEPIVGLLEQFKDPLINIVKGNHEARKVVRHFGTRGNRAWFDVCNLTFAPFCRRMKEELEKTSNTTNYEAPFESWTDALNCHHPVQRRLQTGKKIEHCRESKGGGTRRNEGHNRTYKEETRGVDWQDKKMGYNNGTYKKETQRTTSLDTRIPCQG